MSRKRKKMNGKKTFSILPIILFNLLFVFVFLLIVSFYFVFFHESKIKVLSSSVMNLQTVSSIQRNLNFQFSDAPDKKMIEKSFKIEPLVLGLMTWKDDKNLVFQFEENLKSQTRYNVEFAYASSPSPFFPTTPPEIYNLQFETGKPPEIMSSVPSDEEENVSTNKYIIFTFDKKLKTQDFSEYFLIKPKTEGELSVKDNSLIFEPKNKLRKDTMYFAGVLKGLEEEDSQQLANDYFINFRTVDGRNIKEIREVRKIKAPILMYHNVGKWDYFEPLLFQRFKIEPLTLEEHLRYIKENYNVVSLQDLYDYLTNDIDLPPNPVVLSFDDGWKGLHTDAFPILKKLNLRFTAYLISDYLDNNSGYLTKKEVQKMLDSGLMELGNHTRSHALLGFFDKDAVRAEIRDAERQFEKYFGVRALTFSYPGGSYNKSVIETVEELGFNTAVTVKAGTEQNEDELLLLKRIEIEGTDTVADLERKLKL